MIKERLAKADAIKFGKFTLLSVEKTNYYVDIKSVMTDPVLLNHIAKAPASKVSAKKIAGVELWAVPILVAK
jgi:orotate phosphoribosyltransferase